MSASMGARRKVTRAPKEGVTRAALKRTASSRLRVRRAWPYDVAARILPPWAFVTSKVTLSPREGTKHHLISRKRTNRSPSSRDEAVPLAALNHLTVPRHLTSFPPEGKTKDDRGLIRRARRREEQGHAANLGPPLARARHTTAPCQGLPVAGVTDRLRSPPAGLQTAARIGAVVRARSSWPGRPDRRSRERRRRRARSGSGR
jgi:hypothetical protein